MTTHALPTDWCDGFHTRPTNARDCVRSVGPYSGEKRHRHVCGVHLRAAKAFAMTVTVVPVDKCTGENP